MRLIKRTALQICENLWIWCAEYPEKEKEDYPEWEKNGGSIPEMMFDCPCCAYTSLDEDLGPECTCCPLFEFWPRGDCSDSSSPYTIWSDTNKKSRFGRLIRISCATLVANAAREERLRLERKAKLRKEREK